MINYNVYGNFSLAEEQELRAKQIIMNSDAECLDQYKYTRDLHLRTDPLGDASVPYMNLPLNLSLQDNLTYR